MGKQKTGIQVKKAPKPEKRIHKQPSFRKCLEREINRLRKHHRHLSTREFSIRLHNFIKMFQIRHQIGRDLTAEAVDCLRICKCCDSWLRKDRFVECYQCEDSYHMGCALGDLTDPEEWLCPSCQLLSDREVTRREILEQFGVSRKVTKYCNKCNEPADNAKIKCIRCQCNYHQHCFQSGSNKLVCVRCHAEIQKEILDRSLAGHATLLEQFSATKKEQFFKQINAPEEEVQQSTVSISWANPICLRPPIRLDQQQIQKYRKSLLYALYSKQMQYTQKPIYKCPKPENVEQVDVTIDRINFKDLSAFEVYKKQPIGPYLIQAVEGMGYDVITERSIPKGTIVCEYVGQVITRRQALSHLQNDSLMELLTGKDADVSLIIKPEEYSNIARFINGINNRNPESRRKANINSVRLNVLGEPKVVLYARRVIKPGESLMYDYNAALDKYPTEDFI